MAISYWARNKYPQAIDALKLNTEKHPEVQMPGIAWEKRMRWQVIKRMRF